MNNSTQPTSYTHAIAICIVAFFVFLIFKCSNNKPEPTKIETNQSAPQEINYNVSTEEVSQPTVDSHTTDELFEVYHYIYSKGTVIKAETNVLFVDGKNNELQVTIDMPDGNTFEYYLKNKVDLGKINGLDSYLYTTDDNEKINVFFKNGREMMGFAAGKQDFVFMNTPDYKEQE